MKHILLVLFCAPTIGYNQQIQCIGTEVTDGYFYQLDGKDQPFYRITNGPMDNDFYFISTQQLKTGTLKAHILSSINLNDTVKYVSGPAPRMFDPYRLADSTCRERLEAGVTVIPFKKGQAGSDPDVEGYTIYVSYAKVEWLHVRVASRAARNEGMDRPVTFDNSVKRKDHYFDYYVPMKVLELKEGIRVYNGKFYTEKEYQQLVGSHPPPIPPPGSNN
ncbi:hypothetical protein [Chitinophaga arvensicola]|uniref:Uncharacterized protein n=1 Tax=Chitinophaga arvensicola TaxID=29529 RepID=A0A1I0PPE1_9BACT|nr:hypothetical protein [Chitinophaga arvensicola]SEW16277.1 hypothetical protein SAMN04488122_0899 [Chitinophaga arvensicola]